MKQDYRYCGTLYSLVLPLLRLKLIWQYSPGNSDAGELVKIPNIGQFRGIKWTLKSVKNTSISWCSGLAPPSAALYKMLHLAAKSADSMLLNLPHWWTPELQQRYPYYREIEIERVVQKKLSESCQKVFKKLLKSCQKVIKKVVKKLSKSCQKL
jgi:hypothetical protein